MRVLNAAKIPPGEPGEDGVSGLNPHPAGPDAAEQLRASLQEPVAGESVLVFHT